VKCSVTYISFVDECTVQFIQSIVSVATYRKKKSREECSGDL